MMISENFHGQNYERGLRTPWGAGFGVVRRLFGISRKLIRGQNREICGVSAIDWNTIPWVRTTLLNDRAVEVSTVRGVT